MPRAPRKFKVVDLMTRQELADGVIAQEALDVLKERPKHRRRQRLRVARRARRWRPLTFAERRVMWDQAHRQSPLEELDLKRQEVLGDRLLGCHVGDAGQREHRVKAARLGQSL